MPCLPPRFRCAPYGDDPLPLRIAGAPKLKRAIREYDPKASGRITWVLFENLDLRFRISPLPEISEVQAGRTSPDNQHAW